MNALRLAPITVKAALPFVLRVHRSLPRVQGAMWAVSVIDRGGAVVGVALVGNPARVWNGAVLTVLRVAVIEKLGALAVLAELATRGTVTTKDVKAHVDPRRWISGGWLEPAGDRGVWKRGASCPNFHEQHPTAYALALEKAKTAVPA